MPRRPREKVLPRVSQFWYDPEDDAPPEETSIREEENASEPPSPAPSNATDDPFAFNTESSDSPIDEELTPEIADRIRIGYQLSFDIPAPDPRVREVVAAMDRDALVVERCPVRQYKVWKFNELTKGYCCTTYCNRFLTWEMFASVRAGIAMSAEPDPRGRLESAAINDAKRRAVRARCSFIDGKIFLDCTVGKLTVCRIMLSRLIVLSFSQFDSAIDGFVRGGTQSHSRRFARYPTDRKLAAVATASVRVAELGQPNPIGGYLVSNAHSRDIFNVAGVRVSRAEIRKMGLISNMSSHLMCSVCAKYDHLIKKKVDSEKVRYLQRKAIHLTHIKMERALLHQVAALHREHPQCILLLLADFAGRHRTKLPQIQPKPKFFPDVAQVHCPVYNVQRPIKGNAPNEFINNDFLTPFLCFDDFRSEYMFGSILRVLYENDTNAPYIYLALDNAIILMLPTVGHTHNSCDAHFGMFRKIFNKKRIYTPQAMIAALNACKNTNARYSGSYWLLQDTLVPIAIEYKFRHKNHYFELRRNSRGEAMWRTLPSLRFAPTPDVRELVLDETRQQVRFGRSGTEEARVIRKAELQFAQRARTQSKWLPVFSNTLDERNNMTFERSKLHVERATIAKYISDLHGFASPDDIVDLNGLPTDISSNDPFRNSLKRSRRFNDEDFLDAELTRAGIRDNKEKTDSRKKKTPITRTKRGKLLVAGTSTSAVAQKGANRSPSATPSEKSASSSCYSKRSRSLSLIAPDDDEHAEDTDHDRYFLADSPLLSDRDFEDVADLEEQNRIGEPEEIATQDGTTSQMSYENYDNADANERPRQVRETRRRSLRRGGESASESSAVFRRPSTTTRTIRRKLSDVKHATSGRIHEEEEEDEDEEDDDRTEVVERSQQVREKRKRSPQQSSESISESSAVFRRPSTTTRTITRKLSNVKHATTGHARDGDDKKKEEQENEEEEGNDERGKKKKKPAERRPESSQQDWNPSLHHLRAPDKRISKPNRRFDD